MATAFSSGYASIYRNRDKNPIGGIKQADLELLCTLRYDERVVGYKRYYAALGDNNRISHIIRVMRIPTLSLFDVVSITSSHEMGEYYRIVQMQFIDDEKPAVVDLSLERIDVK